MSDPRISTEHDRLAEFFQTDKVNCAYLLGDLEPGFREMGTWYVQEDADGAIQAVLMIYTGLSAPVMITHGQMAINMSQRLEDHPGRCFVSHDNTTLFDQVLEISRAESPLHVGLDLSWALFVIPSRFASSNIPL